jgi:outer membrane protein, heavy metal efflux system
MIWKLPSAGARTSAILAGFVLFSMTGCAGWQQPRPDPKHIDEVNALFNDRTNAALDAMALLKTEPQDSVESPTGVLTSDKAVQKALEHNLSLVASVESLPIAQASLIQAGLLPNPTLGQTSAFYYPLNGGDTIYDLLITEPINAFFTLPTKQAVAKAQRFQAGIDLANQAFGLAQQVRSQFDQLASLERSRQLQERIAQTYKQAVDEAQAQMRVGMVTRVDVNRAMIQYEDAVRQQKHFQTQFEGAAQQMNWLLGVQATPLWTLPDSIKDPPTVMESLPDSGSLEKLAVKYRLDLLRAYFDNQIADASVKLAKLGLIPQTTVGFDAVRNGPQNWAVGPQLTSLVLPIFDPGIVALWTAKYQRIQTQRNYIALEGQVHQDVRNALNALQIADEDVRFYKERIIPQEEENVREQQLSFKLGNAQFDDLLNTIREYVGVLQNYEAAIQAYEQAVVGLETAVGLSFGRVEEMTRGAKRYDTTLPFVTPPTTLPAELPSLLRPGALVPATLPYGVTTLPSDLENLPKWQPGASLPPPSDGGLVLPTTRPATTQPSKTESP